MRERCPDDAADGFRRVFSPLTEDQLRPPEPTVKVVQFCTPLSEAELRRLAAFLREYPSLGLYVYGNGLHSPVADLEFLRDFSFLRRFSVNIWVLENFAGLRHLKPAVLTHLYLGRTKTKRMSLAMLEPFSALEMLSIDGHAKSFGALASLRNLRSLHMRSITVPSLRPLAELPLLRELVIQLGGTVALDELANVEQLASLELTMIRGLHDLGVLPRLCSLENLWLRSLKHVSALPSLRPLTRLHSVTLDQMRALRDYRPIADAPALREFGAIDMQGVPPEAFAPLVEHSTVRKVWIGLGSDRGNERIRSMFAHLATPAAPASRKEWGL